MQIWTSILQARKEVANSKQGTVLTIGNFDGVHRGHQSIMQRAVELAQQSHWQAVVLTFTNHTESLFEEKPLLINMPEIRRELLAKQHLDALLEVEFTPEFADLTPEIFFTTWLVQALHVKNLVMGHDFRFGKEARGNFQLLNQLGKEYQIVIEQVPPVCEDGKIISSSKIRQLLAEGKIELANRMLGYPFVIAGEVVAGEQRGRKLGYPTANIHLEPEYLLPCYGVYLARLTVDGKSYYGMANVGIKPTFGQYAPRVEVYLFDIELNLYQHYVMVEFIRFIRPENRFSGPEALKAQIEMDIRAAKDMIMNNGE